jgi:hypothetical protein
MVESDPHGFARVRNELDSLFPSLKDVATSSVGASIKGHIADYEMQPERITRAYLASAGMEKDSLGARIIESKHTGRWRFACLELFNFMKDYTSPGRASKGYTSGHEEQRVDHTSPWDRNAFLYAMTEVELSMGFGRDYSRLTFDRNEDGTFTALEMYDEICGFGNADADGPAGWRVAHKTYDKSEMLGFHYRGDFVPMPPYFPEAGADTTSVWPEQTAADVLHGTDVASFAPIVAYGSLESLQSMRMAELNACQEGFATEDIEVALGCPEGGKGFAAMYGSAPHFRRSLSHRATHSPFAMQRDVWCNPDAAMSVESAVGNPLMHQLDLYDTPLKDSDYIHHYRVVASDRGEEFIDGTYKQHNLNSWVFVTSSGDQDIRAGMYRLSDLPVFRTTHCEDLPKVQCSLSPPPVKQQNPMFMDWAAKGGPFFNIPPPEPHVYVQLNDNREILSMGAELTDAAGTGVHSSFVNGREGIVLHRCSAQVAAALGYDNCHKAPYAGTAASGPLANDGCYTGDLKLLSDPTRYSTSHFYNRLGPAPSPSPPPPPPEPKPPPPPPSPSPSPSPPQILSSSEAMVSIRTAEEQVCTSVYYLSQTTRCEQLALDLTERLLIHWSPPPSPPPAEPVAPRLPPPPPFPSIPEGLELLQLSSVTLSTMRMPLLRLNDADTIDGYYTNNAALSTAIGAQAMGTRACVSASSPLGCITATLPERCLNGERRCGEVDENGLNPTLDAYFKVPASQYVWGVRLSLPQNQQLAELLVGTKTLELFGPGATPIPCQEGGNEVVGVPVDRQIDIICQAPTATDDDIRRLATVERLRLTLTGQYRQVWLASVQPILRLLSSADLDKTQPPPPNVNPRPPPSPPGPVDALCTFQAGVHLVDRDTVLESTVTATHEPCGLDATACCNHADEHGAQAFDLDDSGCCTLLYYSTAPAVQASTALTGRWSASAGFGTVN